MRDTVRRLRCFQSDFSTENDLKFPEILRNLLKRLKTTLSTHSKSGEDQTDEWIEENMLAYNILRLNWHEKTEDGSLSPFRDRKPYLDLMFEKAGIR